MTTENKRNFFNNFEIFPQLPSTWTWQNLRDKFRDIGEVKFAEIRGLDTGVVRFSKEREAEVAISEYLVEL